MDRRLSRAGVVCLFVVLALVTAMFSAVTEAAAAVSVAISPTNTTMTVGVDKMFYAQVTGATNTAVTWTVNNIGGSSTFGWMYSSGRYVAPSTPPPGGIVTIKATSVEDPTASASATVTIVSGSGGGSPPPPPPNQPPAISVTVSPANPSVNVGVTIQFSANVANNANSAVTWKVNGVAGGAEETGTITNSGLYTAPVTLPPGGVVTVGATAQADGVTTGSTAVIIKDPTAITYGRFLDQTTFGATPALMAQVQQIGFENFLDNQFAMAESPWPDNSANRNAAIDAFFANAMNGQDQLRQRVIYALSEIIVESSSKNTNGNQLIPWLKILSKNAFGNYKTLLQEITLDASMGHFLDLANSGSSGAANENYPRELLQLFSIGLVMLNDDGSTKTANGQPIPSYTQTDVQQLARALTGWTYDNAAHTVPNGAYYPGPMVPYPPRHDVSSKTFLGTTLPAGQTIQKDLDDALTVIFNHPNVGPFVATRLIRALVTSNPSPQYISAITGVFNDNGMGVRGDMKSVIRAILMHPEARNDNPGATFGRLRTPMQFIIAVSRALNAPRGPASQFNWQMVSMSESILGAPSVFGHYSPMFRIPNSGGLFGPEFQIYSASDAVNRANFLYSMIYQYPQHPVMQPLINIAGNSAALLNAVDSMLLFGRMSAQTRTTILNALPSIPDNNQRAVTALYITAMSGEYQVQR